ncbi:hypothetical protein I4U23_022430 [Adineta vaga]|nr:hypothetical protein I4U23_022430 [Adineta vaga]
MLNFHIFIIILLFIFHNEIKALSFNQPNLSSAATWNRNGITFANESIVGEYPRSIFINTNNTIYIINQNRKRIVIWFNNSLKPTHFFPGNFSTSYSLFVTSNGNIYIDNGFLHKKVERWISKNMTFDIVMSVNSSCYDLFVDINDNLYCSMQRQNKVVKRDLKSSSLTPVIIAGTGNLGFASNELNSPHGIFVDINLDLYVADCGNNRIQLFQSGEINAITVVGTESLKATISLKSPSVIVLDAKQYLFIVDSWGNRIVGEGPYGFRCLIGCYGAGSRSNQLNKPITMSFDSFGNIFVVDNENHRIQKFFI